ncbi:hypothetical protein GQ53DRAFT_438522 [Thozetella sp. PMI_491]|nr:hypothetical protein GQ53DRAFT_438522 [Thozetella sp. PMI_491]
MRTTVEMRAVETLRPRSLRLYSTRVDVEDVDVDGGRAMLAIPSLATSARCCAKTEPSERSQALWFWPRCRCSAAREICSSPTDILGTPAAPILPCPGSPRILPTTLPGDPTCPSQYREQHPFQTRNSNLMATAPSSRQTLRAGSANMALPRADSAKSYPRVSPSSHHGPIWLPLPTPPFIPPDLSTPTAPHKHPPPSLLVDPPPPPPDAFGCEEEADATVSGRPCFFCPSS